VQENLDDATLVARARDGDQEAFGLLVRRYVRLAHAVARTVVRDPADADDVCQEAFLKALTHLEDCRQPARFAGWLMTIVRTSGHNYRRYLRRREAEPLESGESVAALDDPGRGAERAELRGRLVEGLGRLPESQRRVVLLHDLEGRPHAEVAGALGITEGSSRLLLHRARKSLRGFLEPDSFLKEDP
jgi:RNA polymerase sigma-70 factor (ECF subfamily)